MTVTRIDPFAEFARLQNRMGGLFGDIYVRPALADADGWVPPVDIYETEQHDLVLKAELPGHGPRGHRADGRAQHADAEGHAQAGRGREGRAVPPRRAPLRLVLAVVRAADHGRRRAR